MIPAGPSFVPILVPALNIIFTKTIILYSKNAVMYNAGRQQ